MKSESSKYDGEYKSISSHVAKNKLITCNIFQNNTILYYFRISFTSILYCFNVTFVGSPQYRPRTMRTKMKRSRGLMVKVRLKVRKRKGRTSLSGEVREGLYLIMLTLVMDRFQCISWFQLDIMYCLENHRFTRWNNLSIEHDMFRNFLKS